MKRHEVVEFYIERAKERNIVEEFKAIFELGMTGNIVLKSVQVEETDLTKSMREELHKQIDILFKGE